MRIIEMVVVWRMCGRDRADSIFCSEMGLAPLAVEAVVQEGDDIWREVVHNFMNQLDCHKRSHCVRDLLLVRFIPQCRYSNICQHKPTKPREGSTINTRNVTACVRESERESRVS